jgi:hypothetical protein
MNGNKTAVGNGAAIEKSAPRELSESGACCGGPAPAGTHACCVQDAAAKSAGEDGCGCTSPAAAPQTAATPCCG